MSVGKNEYRCWRLAVAVPTARSRTSSTTSDDAWLARSPLCDDDPRAARRRLLSADRDAWADVALADLERAHPELRRLVERLDVMRWGHAMIRPKPGLRAGAALRAAREPVRGVHFAHTDLSGVALFEEAFDHGLRAAEEVLASRGVPFESMR